MVSAPAPPSWVIWGPPASAPPAPRGREPTSDSAPVLPSRGHLPAHTHASSPVTAALQNKVPRPTPPIFQPEPQHPSPLRDPNCYSLSFSRLPTAHLYSDPVPVCWTATSLLLPPRSWLDSNPGQIQLTASSKRLTRPARTGHRALTWVPSLGTTSPASRPAHPPPGTFPTFSALRLPSHPASFLSADNLPPHLKRNQKQLEGKARAPRHAQPVCLRTRPPASGPAPGRRCSRAHEEQLVPRRPRL